MFEPVASINGTKITWIYINDLKGSLPGFGVQAMANNVVKKGFDLMANAFKQFMSGELKIQEIWLSN